ncbi:MAG: YkgJ family cysteine cluster protein [Chitinophagia bacterium]|jgi:Fe-S-cluster containining protein|nr:YkgJ family cysteine cluster protein [Chitinophagia bacterium]NCA29442.1 YkgJ family cysteine cluster protein [Chitinophagia bacterium]NDD16163.1 YkgJ family cysteine cluster protein [Chitinophagia bacterium]
MSLSIEQLYEVPAPETLKKFQNFLKRVDKRKILKQLPDLHEAAFEKVNCLDCARCCKNYSPRFKMPDIKRISKYLRIKETVFIDTYLDMDQEGDYVANTKPCPFLGKDNVCSIYEHRPTDCQRFPYTDEDVFFKRAAITMKNAEFCPIVHDVMHGLLTTP